MTAGDTAPCRWLPRDGLLSRAVRVPDVSGTRRGSHQANASGAGPGPGKMSSRLLRNSSDS
jgi:hypothetical protein